jgi:hypothetical protein|tara:strand:+ start:2360 stop:3253 length:894 start_codon:yes stop_codon:yes gene_type:complete
MNASRLSTVLILLLSFNLHAAELPNIPSEIDTEDYCALSGEKYGHTIVIIDVSSPLDQAQLDYMKGKVFDKNFYTKYPPFTKFSYLLITNDKKPQSQEFIFSKCRPKTGSQTSYDGDLNTDDENKMILEVYFDDFMVEAGQAFEKVSYAYNGAIPKDKQKSYIYETIATVFDMSKFDFMTGIRSNYKKGTRDLIVISDMMQHTDRLSFYKDCNPYYPIYSPPSDCPSYSTIIKDSTTRDYIQKTSPKNPSSSIKLFMLTFRTETTVELDTSLEKLWKSYLKSAGFRNITVERQLDIN